MRADRSDAGAALDGMAKQVSENTRTSLYTLFFLSYTIVAKTATAAVR